MIVNLSGEQATGHASFPWVKRRGQAWRLDDAITGASYERSGDDLVDGLYVSLDPWGAHVFSLAPPEPEDDRP